MIQRIVRMEFQPAHLADFRNIFDQSKHKIRAFPGCLRLELHQDQALSHVLYTYSHWESQAALDRYRKSEMFGQIWPKTKALFAGKPLAYSLSLIEKVNQVE